MEIKDTGYIINSENKKIKLTAENISNFRAKEKFITTEDNDNSLKEISYKELANDLSSELSLRDNSFNNDNEAIIKALTIGKLLIYDKEEKVIPSNIAGQLYIKHNNKCILNRKITIKSLKYGEVTIKMNSDPVLNLEKELIVSAIPLNNNQKTRPHMSSDDLQKFFMYLLFK